jgi:hypothetical protein
MSKYFFDFRPDFNLFNPDTKRATTIYYTVVYFICSMVYDTSVRDNELYLKAL